MLHRELFRKAPGAGTAIWSTISYLDDKGTREEVYRTSSASDTYLNWMRRTSFDNGKTWGNPERLPDVVQDLAGGGLVTSPGPLYYNEKIRTLFQPVMRRMWPGMKAYTYEWKTGAHKFNDHMSVLENGEKEVLMRYESGPDFSPDDPFNVEFTRTNRLYQGTGMTWDASGTTYFPNICYRGFDADIHRKGGVVLMKRDAQSGAWTASNQQYIDPALSSRGLLEPDVAILSDGRLLVVCRGSNTASTPGRKWMLVSEDDGKTLSEVQEFTYDDGSRFYSPSSIHRFIRSTKNGKLYWLANIVPGPTEGNSPRYPLQFAEIDETIPAVKKDSLIVVDDREEGDPESLQLSNFCMLEDIETNDIEVYMTRFSGWEADKEGASVYRYRFSPPK